MENLSLTIDRPHSDAVVGSVVENRPSSWTTPPRTASDADGQLEGTEEFPTDLSIVSTRQLRVLCNQRYKLLDTEHPPVGAREQYKVLVEELEHRETRTETQAETSSAPEVPRGTFRDNWLLSRFELFRDGIMAGYVKYEMRGGDVLLLQTVVDSRFRRMNLEPLLIRHVVLNVHRRRLTVIPYCPESRDFLADNPQYLTLLSARQRRRFDVRQAAHDRSETAGG